MYKLCWYIFVSILMWLRRYTNCTSIIAYTESGCNITGRSVWLLLANAMFITVMAAQASETYFRVITLILFLSA